MAWMRLICLMAAVCGLFATSAQAYNIESSSIDDKITGMMDTEGSLTLTIENGSTGILTIRYVMIVPDNAGRSTYVFFADRRGYSSFVKTVWDAVGQVIADFDGTEISVRLKASNTGNLYGRIVKSNERVIIVPGK